MPFEGFDPNDKQESESTLYRFAEMEIVHLCQALAPLNLSNTVYQEIARRVDLPHDLLQNGRFTAQRQNELVRMLRHHGKSYNQIKELTGASNRFISWQRFQYDPCFTEYNGWTPAKLLRWNTLKEQMQKEFKFLY